MSDHPTDSNNGQRRPHSFIQLGNGTTWPNPQDPLGIQDALQSGRATRAQQLIASSFMSAYRQMIWCSRDDRQATIRRVREVLTAPDAPEAAS